MFRFYISWGEGGGGGGVSSRIRSTGLENLNDSFVTWRQLVILDCLSLSQGRRWNRQIDTNQKRPRKTPEAEVLWRKFQG